MPDLPGFGRSPKPKETLSIEELGTALNHFMDALGIEQAVVVGNSLGCAITAELVAEAPEKVSKAVMVGLAGGPHNRPLGKALVQMARDGLVEPPTLLPVAAPDYLRYGMVRAIKLFDKMTKFPAYERFMSLPVPVMVVIGSEDPLRPPWREHQPGAGGPACWGDHRALPGCGTRHQLHPPARARQRDPAVRRRRRGPDGRRQPGWGSRPAAQATRVIGCARRAGAAGRATCIPGASHCVPIASQWVPSGA